MDKKYSNGLERIKTKFIKGFVILSYGFPYFSYDIKNYMRTLKDFGYFVKKKELEKMKFESLDIYTLKDYGKKNFYIIFIRVPEILREEYRDTITYIGIKKEEAKKLKIHRTLEDLLDPSLLESSPNKKIKGSLEKIFKDIYIVIPKESNEEEIIFWQKIYFLSYHLNIDKDIVDTIKKDISYILQSERKEIKYKLDKKTIGSIYA